MKLRNSGYFNFAERVKRENKKIVVYGAGMIGQVIIPYILENYNLQDYLLCFIDADVRKQNQFVHISNKEYRIESVEYLKNKANELILLISNSKYFDVIEELEKIQQLNALEAYIFPIMKITSSNEFEMTDVMKGLKCFSEAKIPKVINYCWFGKGELSAKLKECMASWKKFCPDYEIKLWNEENFDINKYEYTKQAYCVGKYSFVTDLARLDILYEHGGIYLDTDVKMIKSFDDLLYQNGFIATEKWGNINSGGGCGFVAGHPMLKQLIEYRKQFKFIKEDGTYNVETNGFYETKIFMNHGYHPNNLFQQINDVGVYPSYVFHPYDYVSQINESREETHSIHMFEGTWMDENDIINRKQSQDKFNSIMGRMQGGTDEL